MTAPKLEKRKPVTLAYIENIGPYDRIPFDRLVPRLYEWAKDEKVMPGFYPIGIFHSDPKTTAPEQCRYDIAITVRGNPLPGGDVKIRRLPAMTVAALSHKGPARDYQKSYDALTEFIRTKGYRITGPPMEVYSKKPEAVGGETVIYAKIMFPVRKG